MPGLLDSLQVKGFTLKNRIVLPPLQSGRANFEGEVTNRLINFYVMRSAAIGLPIVEHAYVSATGKIGPKQLSIHKDSLIEGLTGLVNSVHAVGTPIVIQISHAGGVANKKVIGTMPVGPSAREKSRELTVDELEVLSEDFKVAAERAVEAGFDGVELHGAHGYLLNQFFSPLFNRRTDHYGGSLENRMRFPLLVAEKVCEVLKGKLLLYRLGADDLAPYGTNIKGAIAFAKCLENKGVDIIDVSGGMCGADPKQLRRQKAYFVPQAHEIKKSVKVPVIGVGRITNAEQADKLIEEGQVDLVAVGRALWKDSKWAEKAIAKLKK
ncbi:MAG: NADH:flavin oxidoreductase [Crenarchaeota archaeon]|nr:NADH:flavin oxidoreductase [Thermoproteota archaeon]